MAASLSIDLHTGWNLTDPWVREFLLSHVKAREPKVVLVCPPCTDYSTLQNLNVGRVAADVQGDRQTESDMLLAFAMKLCSLQLDAKRGFIFDHPQSASRWSRRAVSAVANRAGVDKVVFDGCKYGLTTPLTGLPMRKPTTLLTNLPSVIKEFSGKRCQCIGDHQPIRGYEGGVLLSQHASHYPDSLVQALVQCAREYIRGEQGRV
jgi:hypothetical protein